MALANECQPFIEDSGMPRLTGHAGDALTGKRVVKVKSTRQSGPALNTSTDGSNYVVTPATAGSAGFGVAAYDCADEGKVAVIHAPGTVLPITAGDTITAGDLLQVGTGGKVIPANGGNIVGLAMADAVADADAEVLWYGATGGGTGGATAEATAVTAVTLTATNPAAITAAAGEATAADLTLTQGLETQVSALVVDVAALNTAVNAIITALEVRNIVAPN